MSWPDLPDNSGERSADHMQSDSRPHDDLEHSCVVDRMWGSAWLNGEPFESVVVEWKVRRDSVLPSYFWGQMQMTVWCCEMIRTRRDLPRD